MVVLGSGRELIMAILVLQIWARVMDGAKDKCNSDKHCKTHQVCCKDRCRSWPKCFLSSDKECYYDTHCIKGEICVHNVCEPAQPAPSSCHTDMDCVYKKHLNSHERLVKRKCCNRTCVKGVFCPNLNYSTTVTPTTRPNITITEPMSDENSCRNHSCAALEITGITERSANTLSKAGFLSAAILTAAVFLIVMCCCFVRESKYFKFCGPRTRPGASSTPYRSQSTRTASPFFSSRRNTEQQQGEQQAGTSDSARAAASWTLFPGLYWFNETGNCYSTNRETPEQGAANNLCRGPPSYHSVYVDHELPPTYEEAVNYCPAHFYSVNTNSRTDQSSSASERCS